MSLQHKIDFAVVFEVKNANPNGDPLNGNRPRTDYDSVGEVTDVCLKRKIRDRLAEKGRAIFVQSNDRKTDDAKSLRDRAEKALGSHFTAEATAEKACKEWLDVRAFGQLFAFKQKGAGKKKKSDESDETSKAEGEGSVSIGIRGPVTIQSAFSVNPVEIASVQITKSVNSENAEKEGGRTSDTMGMKHRVNHGVYLFFGSMNPQLAEKTGFNDKDAQDILDILPRMFENDASSARPEGSMRVLKAGYWQHNSKAGQYSSATVHRSFQVNPDLSISISPLEGLAFRELPLF